MWDSRWLWDLCGLMQCNFNRRSAHEMCVCEACAVFANRWPTWAMSDNRPWFVSAFMWRRGAAIVTVEGSHVSTTKEGAPGAKQNKGHITGIFSFWGYHTPRVCSRRANNYQGILCGGLATCAWISLPKTTGKMAGWRLDPAPWQCARTHFTSCAAVFGQTWHRSVAAATMLTRSHTVWHFPIPKA